MERGFLGSGVKKKDGGSSKEGVSKDGAGAAPILGDIAKRVKSIDGVINVPKSILRKPARVVSSDVQEGAKPINVEGSGSKVSFEGVSKVSAVSSTQGLGSSNLGSDPTITNDVAANVSNVAAKDDGLKTGGSFASLLRPNEASNKVHFRTLVNDEKVESVDCVLPKAAAAKVKGRYENSIVGFFLGKDPSFPVVQQYVSNTWRKFGFERITRNDDGVYLFKFATKSGRDQVIEKGPWLIRKSPIILSKWSPSVSLKRGEVTKVPVWVKLYNVPVLAYSEDGLSLLATQIDAVVGLKKEVIMAIQKRRGMVILRRLFVLRVREEVPNNSARDTKATVMVENDDGFTEVSSAHKEDKKGSWIQAQTKVKNVVVSCVLKKWDVINESDSIDGEDGFTSYGTFMGGGNQLEEEDFDFYDGYEDQVVDLHGALKEYRDFKLSMSGRK
ncbi:hypothetical protein Tco_1247375 [Tanacetum coccineum]